MSTDVTSKPNTQLSGSTGTDLADALQDVSSSQTTKRDKKIRLLVGEGDFSFTAALLERHNFSGECIIASELRPQDELIKMYGVELEERLVTLQQLGVELLFNLDATKLHLHEHFKRVHRIYFNFPYTNQPVNRNQPSDTARLLRDFFASAAQVQKQGDRILLTLVYKKKSSKREWWDGHTYGIVSASRENRYELVSKRRFSDSTKGNRYADYTHQETNRKESSENAKDARQYVFERVTHLSKLKSKTITANVNGMNADYFEDRNTSDGSDTDSDTPAMATKQIGMMFLPFFAYTENEYAIKSIKMFGRLHDNFQTESPVNLKFSTQLSLKYISVEIENELDPSNISCFSVRNMSISL